MARIELQDVSKVYTGGVRAVNALSLDIPDGDFMVFVGPSGCGKSTALRMVAGLEDITEGEIRIGDRVVNDMPPKDRDIAMVFQNYALYPHMTVEDNLAFGLQLRKTPKEEQKKRVAEAAKMLALEPFLKRKPAALSGGQRQRVAMGRAIVRNPQAYLMDEPLSNLDAKLRVSMRAQLSSLHERLGVTTVYVTHDQIEAMTLGSRVAVLKDGELMQVDTPQMLFDAANAWHRDHGAALGEKSGWERVNWYERNAGQGDEALRPRGWAGEHWSPAIGAEHRAARESVALFDESSFSKLELAGPGAAELLERLCDNRVAREVGKITYTQMLNRRGGIECDFTVARLADERFSIVTGTAFGNHDREWIRRHLPDHGVELRDVTSAWACFGIWGPRAREVLEPLTPRTSPASRFRTCRCARPRWATCPSGCCA